MDPSVIVGRFSNNDSEASESVPSSSTTPYGSNWQQLNRHIRTTQEYVQDAEAQQAARTVHRMAARIQLQQREIEELKGAISVKKKRAKPSRALHLEQSDGEHGGAVFWSPRRIREARIQQFNADREKQEQQLQNAEAAKAKKQAQLYQKKIAEERRVT